MIAQIAENVDQGEFDFRTWLALKRLDLPRPPYSPDFYVTPHSRFSEYVWRFKKDNLAHGSKKRDKLTIARGVRVADGKQFWLKPETLIMQQFKETLTGFIFHRAHLRSRIEAPKSASLIKEGKRLLILYANFGAAGFESIGDVKPAHLKQVFQRLPNADSIHDSLVGYFEDILSLSREKLITSGPTGRRYKVETKQPPKEFFVRSKTRTLEDDETSFLLRTASFYISSTEMIVQKIREYDARFISNQSLGWWAYNNLPIKSGLERANVRGQLIWLIRISAYSFMAFHLGSRASEVLSATGTSIEIVTSSIGLPDEVYIWLTVTKGAEGDGERRRYRVHPYFRRIFESLRLLNDCLNIQSDGYIFQQLDDVDEICTSNLIQKLKRFVLVHGEQFDMSTHTLRFTLADLVVVTCKKPFHLLQQRYDHKFIKDAIGYGMHGPGADELRGAAREAAAALVEDFIAECQNDELGGVQGSKISAALASGSSIDDLRSDMEMLGIAPVKVRKNTYCLISAGGVPPCSTSANRQRREIARCRADCIHQAQTADELDNWFAFIRKFPVFAADPSVPMMEKVRMVAQLEQNLVAWPSLKNDLEEMLNLNSDLRHYFE
ncbi:hypothetical protein ELH70_15365 [Rhizobium ruizarguesonis]|uniref:hypothetical protein n=1 Tax=Rhizobium ruizarguesonis TaxID=2081791 RepID=UPI001030C622|nr:hypothetical protein [Rhizobium ruizarguesonis]TAZ73930.1 hypothetical protein ELH70_15365 [Rhizobium ruizarguesonis]TBA00532.1 hypothetical protein ELH69_14545 [Rhizobium ruizarguesonis]